MSSPETSSSDSQAPPGPGATWQTDWSMILDAVGDHQPSREAMNRLARRYWPAIFAFVRASGRDSHTSADLTQGFICDVLIGRNLFKAADPTRGRFRSLLLSSLQNYLRDADRRKWTRKRMPAGGKVLSLDAPHGLPSETSHARTPEQAFSAEWGATLVRQVLDEVRDGCVADGLDAHWEIFDRRVVRPMLTGGTPVGYEELIGSLGVESASQAANMMVTVKRRFANAIRNEVASTVRNEADVEDEIKDLMRSVEGGAR